MEQTVLNLKKNSILLGMLMLLALSLSQPQEAVSAPLATCSNGGLSGCHFSNSMVKDGTARNTPSGRFLGTHARHSGYSTSSAKREYTYACTKCHGLAGGYTSVHQTGFKNISGSSLPKARYSAGAALNGRIPNTNTPTFGNCSNIYCHSNGRGTGMGQKQYSSARWAGGGECRACHGGRTVAAGTPARSIGNFTLTTTHSQHLKYPAANINCQSCHYKTATDAATLKSYSAALRHNNGVRDVNFSGVTYGSYTSYKSTETGSAGTTKNCNNTSCHGGKSRGVWSATAQNLDNACLHCHGAGTGLGVALRADKYNAAPGWGGTGTSTDQIALANDNRVGAHFKHLSSVYMPKLKCNECHAVPTGPFDGTHMATMRFTSQTLTFAQASTAIKNTTTPVKTDGNAGADAVCSTTYCHGSNMPKGDTSGAARSVEWALDNTMNGTPAVDCASCHGNPPTSVSASHLGKPATTSCVTCHAMVVNASGVIVNKALHMNGSVNVTGDCNGCHKYDVTGTNPWLNTTGTDLAHFKHITFIKTRLGYGTMAVTSQTFGAGSSENVAVCGTCHTSTLAQHNDGSKQITFGTGGTPNTMGAGTGNSMSLVFGGSNPATPTFVTGTNVTCSNLMCHYMTTPNWY